MNDLMDSSSNIRADLLPLPYHVRFAATQRLKDGQSVPDIADALGVSITSITNLIED